MSALPASQLRIGDVDRQQAAAALGEHYAAGRLDLEEYDTRVAAAYAARTSGELVRLFVDLPDMTAGRPAPRRRRSGTGSLRAVPVLVLLALVLVPAFVAVAHVFPFFLIPVLWFWVGRRRHAWH